MSLKSYLGYKRLPKNLVRLRGINKKVITTSKKVDSLLKSMKVLLNSFKDEYYVEKFEKDYFKLKKFKDKLDDQSWQISSGIAEWENYFYKLEKRYGKDLAVKYKYDDMDVAVAYRDKMRRGKK